MTPDRWRRITEVFHLVKISPGGGAYDAFDACGDDLAMRADVEAAPPPSGVMIPLSRQRLEQPRARGLPVSLDSRDRHSERFPGFFERQSAEEP
jgi:hypothetical protein